MLENTNAFSSFSVKDISQTKRFYEDLLGIQVIENEMGILELHIRGGQPVIMYPKPNHSPASFTVLNFFVPDIEKTVVELNRRGIVLQQYEGAISTNKVGIHSGDPGPKIGWFKDPSGNILSVIEEQSG